MNNTVKKIRISIPRLTVILVLFALLAVVLQATISLFVLRTDLRNSSNVFLNQVEDVLAKNEEEEQLQLDGLKETYMTAAQAAAYILSDRPGLEKNLVELENVAGLLSVDELHIFDETGTIVGGTNPEYYGYNFDSGEQMAYFKPMLTNKYLSMCQDVTPNTAEGKNMMYAIAWDNSGRFMVQVGVEPKRLLAMLKNHEMENVINSIPITEGYDIYAIDRKDSMVVASSNHEMIYKDVKDVLNVFRGSGGASSQGRFGHFDKGWYYLNYRIIDDYVIGVTYDLRASNGSMLASILTLFAYLFIVGFAILVIVVRSRRTEDAQTEAILKQYDILSAMANVYYSMHLVDLPNDTCEEFKSQGTVKRIADRNTDTSGMMRRIMTEVTAPESLEDILAFTDFSTLADRMGTRKLLTREFLSKKLGWFLAAFFLVEADENGRAVKVLFATRSIDDRKKKEETLIYRSNTDELTGCYNRRFYEETIQETENTGVTDDLVYLSVDVNGLKVVNDTIGHSAGDELIIGVSECLKNSVGKYGRVFRTGGDEFAVLLQADPETLQGLLKNLKDSVEHWSGEQVEHLSMSCGCVSRTELPEASVRDMALLADKKMYEEKSRHYRARGMDRRGQRDAHKALCALYAKILKVNLTEDSYQVVNMEEDERTQQKGFADTLSGWLSGFGRSGQVHPEDLEEYLRVTDMEYMRKYFLGDRTSLHIFYRRKCGEAYKRVMMEIIPADDYSKDSQSMYLYVKDVDI